MPRRSAAQAEQAGSSCGRALASWRLGSPPTCGCLGVEELVGDGARVRGRLQGQDPGVPWFLLMAGGVAAPAAPPHATLTRQDAAPRPRPRWRGFGLRLTPKPCLEPASGSPPVPGVPRVPTGRMVWAIPEPVRRAPGSGLVLWVPLQGTWAAFTHRVTRSLKSAKAEAWSPADCKATRDGHPSGTAGLSAIVGSSLSFLFASSGSCPWGPATAGRQTFRLWGHRRVPT